MRGGPRQQSAPEAGSPPRGAASNARASVTWSEEDRAYLLSADDSHYRIPLDPPGSRGGLFRLEGRVGETEWQPLVRGAGMLLRGAEGAVLPPSAAEERCVLEDVQGSVKGKGVQLRYTEIIGERRLQRTLLIRLNGRSLEIEVSAPTSEPGEGYCGFTLGHLGPEGARQVPITGLPERLVVMPGEGFLCGYPDRFRGFASAYPPGGAFYRQDTEGQSHAIEETFYLTLSPQPLDPLPSLRSPAAPFRIALEDRITLDYYSTAPYAEDARRLWLLREYGLQDVLLIYRNWQQFGYDRRGPLHYPANEERGTNEQFRQLMTEIEDGGWLVALREEYAAISQDSPYWSDKAVARWWDGQPRRLRQPGRYAIAGHRMLEFARLEATKIQRNYRPTAAFVDGHTAWNPEDILRQTDGLPNSRSATEAQVIRQVQDLLAFLRDVHEGPVIGSAGEGGFRFDSFTSGMAEGVVRGPDEGAESPLIVDYELEEVRGKLLGIGAGSYAQFARHSSNADVDAARMDWDAYRAVELALGHTGYVGNWSLKSGPRGEPMPGGGAEQMVREYFLLRALQERYLRAPVQAIRYRRGDDWLTLTEALRSELDLTQPQLRIEYGGGLTLWINRAREVWPVALDGTCYDVPQNGFLAATQDGKLLAYSALVANNRADFCRCPQYVFVDARSQNARRVDDFVTDGCAALFQSAVPGRQDVVFVGARQLVIGEDEYRLSERGDVRIKHLSAREIEVIVLDTESGKPAHVTWPALTPVWKSSRFDVREREGGAWHESRCPVQQTRTGPQLNRAHPGIAYRISVPVF